MKSNLILILLTLTLTSCFFSDYKSEKIKSSTGNYEVQASVNRTDKNADNYSEVIIHIFDRNNKKLTEFNTGVGDANKWSMGWTESGDTIVLQSSDVGNKAWILQNEIPIEIKITDELNKRADFLKSKKYE
jgi:hypothetical protein